MFESRINYFLTAKRRIREQSIYFHGTNSKFLRSILKHGLDHEQIKEGVWQTEKLNKNSPSMRSYDGIYLAKNINIAFSHATYSVAKFNGNPLLVICKIQKLSTINDEDSISFYLEDLRIDKNTSLNIHTELLLKHYYVLAKLTQFNVNKNEYLRKALDYYVTNILNYVVGPMENRRDVPEIKSLLEKIFLYSVERYVSHIYSENQDNFLSSIHEVIHHIKGVKYSQEGLLKFVPPSPIIAEQNLRAVIDKFIRKLPVSDKTDVTLRITSPIKFSGRNRIECILSFLDYAPYIKVHYGDISLYQGIIDNSDIGVAILEKSATSVHLN